MKSILWTLALIQAIIIESYGQAKKPTIMVVPSDDWCISNGYVSKFIDGEELLTIPDYSKALSENSDLNNVISKIGELMSERDFPLIDLKAQLDKISKDKARTNMKGVKKSPIDLLNEMAKADIVLKVFWRINSLGPQKNVEFRLQGIDSYTAMQIAASSGVGHQSYTNEVAILIKEAVISNIDLFNEQLMTHFEDILANGRIGQMVLLVSETSDLSLNQNYSFKNKEASLKEIISKYWMPRNTEKGRFNLDENSENILKFSQVRISLYGDDGWGGTIAYDFAAWGENLKHFLKNEFNIDCSLETKGLGEVEITIL